MSTDNSSSFAADLDTSTAATETPEEARARLQRELAELNDGTEVDASDYYDDETTIDAAEAPGAEVDVTDDDDDETTVEALRGEEVDVYFKSLGKKITISRPTDVEVTLLQQDLNSAVMTDGERMGAYGDFCRVHMSNRDFRAWRQRVVAAGFADPSSAGVAFYDALQELTELLVDNATETDEGKMNLAQNRAERRAAERQKAARAKKRK